MLLFRFVNRTSPHGCVEMHMFHKQSYAAGGDDCANIIVLGILSNPESAI